jgi:hypothetical protein
MGIPSAAKARGEDQDRRRRRRPDLGGLQLQNEPHRGADARAGGGPVMVRRAAARLPARPPACLLACLDLGLDGRCIVSRTCPAASLGRPHEPRPRRWPRPVLCSRDEYRADTAPPRPHRAVLWRSQRTPAQSAPSRSKGFSRSRRPSFSCLAEAHRASQVARPAA